MIGPCIPDSVDFHFFFQWWNPKVRWHFKPWNPQMPSGSGSCCSVPHIPHRRRAPRVLKRLLEAWSHGSNGIWMGCSYNSNYTIGRYLYIVYSYVSHDLMIYIYMYLIHVTTVALTLIVYKTITTVSNYIMGTILYIIIAILIVCNYLIWFVDKALVLQLLVLCRCLQAAELFNVVS
jgi:hypothetical protein